MYPVLLTLVGLNFLAVAATATMGVMIESTDSVYLHFLWGLGTTILICFTHLLVLFYLIGTEGDIKEALEPHPDLAETYVPRAKALKMRAFPAGSGAVLLTIFAALMGGEVHSRLLMQSPPDQPPPVREISVWWHHLVFVIIALTVNIVAFQREFQVVRENRRTIVEINEKLESREGAESAS
ncbi:MAG: hypothetical protein AAF488_14165 [Planctomycetota bacterium]